MTDLELLLFTTDESMARDATRARLSGIVVDWEDRCAERSIADDGARPDTAEHLRRIAEATDGAVWCRINALGTHTPREIDLAIDSGATHVLVPMIESPAQVEDVLDMVGGRAKAGIMIETVCACTRAAEIARVPVDFVYVGLLDLAIDRGEGNIFRPLADGTADRLRSCFVDTPFGIGGVTVVDGGAPVPFISLLAELARLRIDFVFARRSFTRDVRGRDMALEHQRIQAAWRTLLARDAATVDADHREFAARFGQSRPRPVAVGPAR